MKLAFTLKNSTQLKKVVMITSRLFYRSTRKSLYIFHKRSRFSEELFKSNRIKLPSYILKGCEDIPLVPEIHGAREICQLRSIGKRVRMLLDSVALFIKPGTSTAEIDRFVLEYCLKHSLYPSPLGYKGFPSTVCTSVNEVAIHGLPSKNAFLRADDLISVDVSLYDGQVHGDSCVTFLVSGESGLPSAHRDRNDLLLCAQKCCQAGVSVCGPGVPYRFIAEAVSQAALSCGGFRVVAGLNGHGIGTYFHGPPDICHSVHEERPEDDGVMCLGHVFTIEPCVAAPSESSDEEAVEKYVALPVTQSDGWSVSSSDHALTAQFEEMVLITDDGYELLSR
ncbi:unnamed protein product [Schistocephalus solidus]|uniref:Peptidase_M24 domain-containing protein n=1 Tax=Schistocephalus solidus TaxID=70667 RepID=A0A183TP10_SCHSO|nr:unnamed protein product [Schistocephalus solidus]